MPLYDDAMRAKPAYRVACIRNILSRCSKGSLDLAWSALEHPSRFVVRHGWVDGIRSAIGTQTQAWWNRQ